MIPTTIVINTVKNGLLVREMNPDAAHPGYLLEETSVFADARSCAEYVAKRLMPNALLSVTVDLDAEQRHG